MCTYGSAVPITQNPHSADTRHKARSASDRARAPCLLRGPARGPPASGPGVTVAPVPTPAPTGPCVPQPAPRPAPAPSVRPLTDRSRTVPCRIVDVHDGPDRVGDRAARPEPAAPPGRPPHRLPYGRVPRQRATAAQEACGRGRSTGRPIPPHAAGSRCRSALDSSRQDPAVSQRCRGGPSNGVRTGAASPMKTTISWPPGLVCSGTSRQLLASQTLPEGSIWTAVLRSSPSLV